MHSEILSLYSLDKNLQGKYGILPNYGFDKKQLLTKILKKPKTDDTKPTVAES